MGDNRKIAGGKPCKDRRGGVGDNMVGTTNRTKSSHSYPEKTQAKATAVGLDVVNFPSDFYGPTLNSAWSGYHFEQ